MKLTLYIAFGFALFSASHAQAKPWTRVSTLLELEPGLSCRAYLWLPDGEVDRPLIFYAYGTGIYSAAENIHPAAKSFLEKGRAAVLTFDKPGIENTLDKGSVYERDVFARHRQGHLVACAKAAVAWASEKAEVGADSSILLLGHSEGAQVLTRLYAEWMEQSDPETERVELLQLSGAPLDDWKKFIGCQMAGDAEFEKRFEKALKENDEEFFLAAENAGVPLEYLKEMFETPALYEMLQTLLSERPELNVEFHHGLEDAYCSVDRVKALHTWQLAEQKGGKLSKLSAHYYPTGHFFNREALKNMIESVDQALKKSSN